MRHMRHLGHQQGHRPLPSHNKSPLTLNQSLLNPPLPKKQMDAFHCAVFVVVGGAGLRTVVAAAANVVLKQQQQTFKQPVLI